MWRLDTFAAREAGVKHQRYSVLEGFADAWNSPWRVLQKHPGAAFVTSRNVSRVVYVRVQLDSGGTSNAF